MNMNTNGTSRFNVTVRVGCNLTYEATGTAWLLLHLKPRPDATMQ